MRSPAIVPLAALLAWPTLSLAQTPGGDPRSATPFGDPVDDRRVFVHGLLEQFEGRFGSDSSFRWEGQGWVGDDRNRLWLKSEGQVTRGRFDDGQQEAYYSRPISPYFDLQAGGRYDLDSGPGRGWAAFGVEGFAPYLFTVAATAYAGDRGRFAFKLSGSNQIRFTQRLVLEPQAELNAYTKDDRRRWTGSGVGDLDMGLRLRYEISRKFAPYVGLTYARRFGRGEDFARAAGDRGDDLRVALGARSWF